MSPSIKVNRQDDRFRFKGDTAHKTSERFEMGKILTRLPTWSKLLGLGFLIFLLFTFITTSATYGLLTNFGREARYGTIFLDQFGKWIPWAFLVPVIDILVNRFPFSRKKWLKPFCIHLMLSVLWLPLYLFLIIAFEVLRGNFGWATLVSEYKAYFGINIFGDYQWYWVIVVAVTALRFGQDLIHQRREKDALIFKNTQLQKNLVESKLQALKAQIQPHFLYNTHNTIGALIRGDQPEKALKVLNLLSRLLRRSLESDMQQTTTLGEELAFIEDYLEIQKMRFPDSLRVQFDIDEESKASPIPAMVLQPLVENAVHHGLVSEMSGDTIRIHAGFEQNILVIRILNQTGPESADSSGFGIGLKNIRSRLNHLYGEAHSLELEYVNQTTISATLILPLGK